WDVENWKAVSQGTGPAGYSRFAFLPNNSEALVNLKREVARYALAAGKDPVPKGQLQCAGTPRCLGVSADGKGAVTTQSTSFQPKEGNRVFKTTFRVWDL